MLKKIILDFAKAVCEGEQTMIDEKKVELMKKLQRLDTKVMGKCPILPLNRLKKKKTGKEKKQWRT